VPGIQRSGTVAAWRTTTVRALLSDFKMRIMDDKMEGVQMQSIIIVTVAIAEKLTVPAQIQKLRVDLRSLLVQKGQRRDLELRTPRSENEK
jgi:hypothetical protein